MNVFTRTSSGLANYPAFHRVDYVVYTEGIDLGGASSVLDVDDIKFFTAVLSQALPTKRVKVKCVGNKHDALAYSDKIAADRITNAVVIVDKDLDGILASSLVHPHVISTFGYSWENEIWSPHTIEQIVRAILSDDTNAVSTVVRKLDAIVRRLKVLSACDAAAQASGFAVINKKKALGGMKLEFGETKPFSHREFKRITNALKSSSARKCPTCVEVAHIAYSKDYRQLIQGHLWSNIAINVIGNVYRAITGDAYPSRGLLTNLAFSELRRNAAAVIGRDVLDRYSHELRRAGIA